MFFHRSVVRIAPWMLAGLFFIWPATSEAADKAEAKRHFETGLAMMELEDFSGAAVEFEASLAAYTSRNAMFNLAMCYKALHKYPKALETFRKVLEMYGSKMSQEDRKEVKKNIKSISRMVGELEINTGMRDVEVLIDGEKVGTTPLAAPVLVGAGEHRVRVSKSGYNDEEKVVAVAAGKTVLVAFAMTEGTEGLPTPQAVPAGPPREQIEVEAIIGGNLTRDYIRYTKTGANQKQSFAKYEYDLARKKRKNGIILMAAIAPIVMGVGVGIYLACVLNKVPEYTTDDEDYNQALQNLGTFFISLAGAGALATLIVGSVRVARGHTRMKKLKPHLGEEASQSSGLRLTGLSPFLDRNGIPGGVAVSFSF